ncbi:MAG TPA: NAD(P)/FAD-dependent oxidoreductase, partial [Polyangia bacterium]
MRRTAFDLVVIGSGVAGSTVAQRCREAGWSVAVVDSRPFGGTCALRGCEPKKVLYEVTEAAERARRLGDKGLRPVGLAIDWPALARFKRTFTDPVTPARERAFSEAGIAVIHGRARFVRPTALRVGEDELDARHVVVAAGARPAELPLEGHEHLAPSDTFLELEQLPARLVFVGGGYVSFELAHVAVRAGAQVTLLHRSRRPLAGFDPDLVARLVEHSRQLGIDVVLEAEAQAIRPAADGYAVLARTPAGTRTVAADLVVHGAGRVPDIDDLDCAVGGVERDRRGVVVDDHLQSVSNPVVYAAG